jgi:restriction endonuclease
VSDLPALTPQYFQILVVRELRKVGFEVPEPEQGFVLELVIPLSAVAAMQRALVVCRRQAGIVARDVVESAKARLAAASADAAIIFATADFAPDALVAASEAGVALLRVADGRDVFTANGWGDGTGGGPDHYPAWLPAHIAQIVDRDAAGRPRLRVLEAGHPELILDCLRLHSSTQ